MKKWLKVVVGIVAGAAVLAALGIGAVFYLTSGGAESANDFFKAAKDRDIARARSYLSEDFKANTDEKALAAFLSNSALLHFKSSSWPSREISGGRMELRGSIATETGGVIPMRMKLVKENGAWKIYAIQKDTAGLAVESPGGQQYSPPPKATALPAGGPTALPGRAQQMELAKKAIHDFVISMNEGTMEHFRTTVSQLWQQQTTTEKLNQSFRKVIDSDIKWQVLEGIDPVLPGDAKVDENGVMVLEGYYSTKPSQVHFRQKCIYEGTSWKLLGFMIETKKAGE